ncbi:MAG: type II toxin-antitoxin system RelE/ParE family toxin [Pelistega sp.]|nr:type II toxin-antitoxin system RelE/ParE family toxin [Pelistega sp.]
MNFDINWTNTAVKQLRKIDKFHQKKIVAAIFTLEDLATAKQVKTLINHQYSYRLRVGNYMVLFDVDTVVRIIDIQEIKKT